MKPQLYERVDKPEIKRLRREAPASKDNDWSIKLSLPLLFLTIIAVFYLVVIFPNYTDGILGPPRLARLAKENMQDREIVHLGKRVNGFRMVNQDKLDKLRNDWADLEEVRFGHCGDFEVGRWVELQSEGDRGLWPHVVYVNSSVEYAKLKHEGYNLYNAGTSGVNSAGGSKIKRPSPRRLRRWLCEKDHPRVEHAKVRIERLGPLYSNGGYDWNTVYHMGDVLNFSHDMHGKTFYVVGRMIANVRRDGSLLGHPPLHTHHAYVYPDSSHVLRKVLPTELTRRYGLPDSRRHHVLIQAYGDTICKDEDGGVACLLDQVPEGQGYRIVNTSGFVGNLQVNDVRAKGSSTLEFYVDIAVVYTMEKRIPTTALQIGSPPVGIGWNTYIMPLDRSSNVMFFNFTNYFLGNGVLNEFALHTHMTYFDSVYVFKGDTVYAKLESLRQSWNRSLPVVFECLPPLKRSPKETLLDLAIAEPSASLVCEGARPSMEPYCESDDTCTYRDKRIEFNCRRDVPLGINETLTVIAFNKIRNTSSVPITRSSSQDSLAKISPFGAGYASIQHSFFQANFVSDQARGGSMRRPTGETVKDLVSGNFAPPALFQYSVLPYPKISNLKDADRVIAHCPKTINFDVDLPWNARELTVKH